MCMIHVFERCSLRIGHVGSLLHGPHKAAAACRLSKTDTTLRGEGMAETGALRPVAATVREMAPASRIHINISISRIHINIVN